MVTANSETSLDIARATAALRTGPRLDTLQTGAADLRFGAFRPGAYVTLTITGTAHVKCGVSNVATTATTTILVAGTHDFVMPPGCTHVVVKGVGGSISAACEESSP